MFSTVVLFTLGAFVLLMILFSIICIRTVNRKTEENRRRIEQEQSALFANIAHDLKTPLTTIIGFSRVLSEDEIQNPQEKSEILKIIHQKAIASNELIDLMFQYTKLESHQFQLNRSKINIASLLREVLAEHYELLEHHEIDLRVCIADEKIELMVDKVEMRRVFANLIINVCKHNPRNTVFLVSLTNNETDVQISFIDNGTKIPQFKKDKLFYPSIKTSSKNREYSGTGLGLAITKSIVDKHGFSISLKEDIAKYTKEFKIICPLNYESQTN